jgi:hypothetical protein
MTREVPPIPSLAGPGSEIDDNDPKIQALRRARRAATDAVAIAEEAEKEAHRLRRAAKNRIRSYEKLVAEYNGQLRLPGT